MTAPEPDNVSNDTARGSLRWWLTALQVRFRFVIIVIMAAVVVSQWQHVQSVWDRLTWKLTGAATHAVADGHEYFCPMDPGVRSVWPAICPICNMDLVPRLTSDAQVLPEGVVARMQLSPYRIQLAGIRTTVIEAREIACEASDVGAETDSASSRAPLDEVGTNPAAEATATMVLAVPESAVVHRGDQHLVYVETMPGMFDGVAVTLGRRCGDVYPVLAGLQAGQKVATAGAFLIDAETRLNPNVAAGYFGANQAAESPVPDPADMTKAIPGGTQKKPPVVLSAEDQTLVEAQKICPVTDLPLDSMGGPLPVMVGDRKVFICCAGCEKRLLDDPDKYLAKLAPAP